MNSLKNRSTSATKSPTSTATNSPKTTERVIKGPVSSYCHWVTLAVAIIAVIVGVYYYLSLPNKDQSSRDTLNKGNSAKSDPIEGTMSGDFSDPRGSKDKIKNERETGLVFDWDVIGAVEDPPHCKKILGGKINHADMLKLHFKSLSKISRLFIIVEITEETKDEAENLIRKCIGNIGIGEYFDHIHAWKSEPAEWQSEIEKVIKMTELNMAKLYFIRRYGEMSNLLAALKYKVIVVKRNILDELDFEAIENRIDSDKNK